MKRILLLSDTHAYWDKRFEDYIEPCDEIWHAGDMCSYEHARQFQELKPFRAVCGNCDGGELRRIFPEVLRWRCEEVEVLMKHIGGYPGHYDPSARRYLDELAKTQASARLYISGHSHILKVKFDPRLQCLHINPGAAGLQGWQQVRTLVRFTIDKADIRDLEVIELN
ncbi:MAG: metallophosphoesterase family protein [Bacteroidaceae bacterium]|nr:metallophosphoesterase family protein [Bacteroidaceae bacterium]MBO4593272.1 metallophosphoesterase family protein [Bacteroidaceae bacterium]